MIGTSRRILHEALEKAGLHFAPASDGAPTASFGVVVPNRPPLDLTADICRDVFRLVAHGALPETTDDVQLLAERDELSQGWRFGRAYFDSETSRWNLSVGLPLLDGPPTPEALFSAIHQLADAPPAYVAGIPPLLLTEQPLMPQEVMPAVEAAVRAGDLPFQLRFEGELLAIRLDVVGFGPVVVELFTEQGTILTVRANATPKTRPALNADVLRRLNALNARLEIGSVGWWHEAGVPYGWLGLPFAITKLDAATIRWCAERSGQLAAWACEAAEESPKANPSGWSRSLA